MEARMINRVKHGVKLLGRGSEDLARVLNGKKITIEVADATENAIEAIKATGSNINVVYRTPLLMREHLFPHKFHPDKTLKTPMPPPKTVSKLEKLREKGLNVEYPRAPWYTDNEEQIKSDRVEKQRRMDSAQHAELLPVYPAVRSEGNSDDKPRKERDVLLWKTKYTV